MSGAQQSKAFSLLEEEMFKPRETPLRPNVEQSGRYTRRRCGLGISDVFWCWLSDRTKFPIARARGAARVGIAGHDPVRSSPVLCWELSQCTG